MANLIELKSLRKEFGPFVAVDSVTLSVPKGQVLGFLGPNGAGKSTTMKMATGFLAPTAGTAHICGHDAWTDPIAAKQRLGYLPEGAPAYGDMTPYGFLHFVGQIRGFSGETLKKRIFSAVEKVSLQSHLYQPIETLSKGFKRRVGLAQAILHDPEVLIMDEPTDGLDPNQKHEVRRLISEMAKDKAIVLSTHILEEVEAVCTRAVIIAAGKVIADGTPDELSARSSLHNAVTIGMKKGGDDLRERLAKVPGVKRVESISAAGGHPGFRLYAEGGRSILSAVNDFLRQQGVEVDELKVEVGRLDDVFRTMTLDASIKAGRAS